MKKFLLVFILLTGFVFSQISVKTTINYSAPSTIYNATLTGVVYSNAFSLGGKEGITSLFMDWDTTGAIAALANQSDSCMTLGFQVKETNIGWSTYYDDRTTHKTIVFTKIDTIDRALRAGQNIVMDISQETANWCVGDSGRFVMFIGTGDYIKLRLELRYE